jgi:hypothetical protein
VLSPFDNMLKMIDPHFVDKGMLFVLEEANGVLLGSMNLGVTSH